MELLAQANFWLEPAGSPALYTKLIFALLVGFGVIGLLMVAPPAARRPVVAFATFLAGLYWVMLYLWPVPIAREPGQLPRDGVESVGFFLKDINSDVVSFTVILTSFMLGLGIYSLMRIHVGRIRRHHEDAFFSWVLIVSLLLMVGFGYADWSSRLGERSALLELRDNWGFVNYARDFLFEGLLQQMDAAMFSIIAFFIMSAAYRAFRVRSVEATILLATALIVILSLMGAVAFEWDEGVARMANGNPLLLNLQLTEISQWLRNTFQTSSLRGIAFGVGIGALAMGLRIWLSLERTGGSA
jgi:hypothetical protein